MLKETTFDAAGGTLGPYTVGVRIGASADIHEEVISFQFDGTWDGSTTTLYLCNNPDASPQIWSPMTSGAYTADVADIMRMPTGSAFKATNSGGTSSPQTAAVFASFRGEFY